MKKIRILIIIYIFFSSSICVANQSENLQKLNDLFEEGILTKNQFNEAKEKILQRMAINNVDKTAIEGLSGGYFPDPNPPPKIPEEGNFAPESMSNDPRIESAPGEGQQEPNACNPCPE